MKKLDCYICTKSKCTKKRVQIKVWAGDTSAGSYNGPGLLEALRGLVEAKGLKEQVGVHEAACMSGCPVGPRLDLICSARRILYFQLHKPTGREDLVSWSLVESLERLIEERLLQEAEPA